MTLYIALLYNVPILCLSKCSPDVACSTVQQQRVLPPVQGDQSDSAGATTPPDGRRLRDPARPARPARPDTRAAATVCCDGLQSRDKRLRRRWRESVRRP